MIRKEWLLEMLDDFEKLFHETETEDEKLLMCELAKTLRDSVEITED